MAFKRYAVFYVPPAQSGFAAFDRDWLGMDIETGSAVTQMSLKGFSKSKVNSITTVARNYGFHGTLRPPFELAPHASQDSLVDAIKLYAKGLKPLEIPPLEVNVIGKFIALVPDEFSTVLESMASGIVRTLEGYRKRQSVKELAQHRQFKLTVHQEQMLEHWGYPYVLEEYRFHLTLTDRVDDDNERIKIRKALTENAKSVLGNPVPMNDIAICGQERIDSAMTVIERISLK